MVLVLKKMVKRSSYIIIHSWPTRRGDSQSPRMTSHHEDIPLEVTRFDFISIHMYCASIDFGISLTIPS